MCRKFQYYIASFCLVLLTAGCGELTPPGERGGKYGSYTVHPGDTLYSISWDQGLDHREVASWNDIDPPYLIYPGQQLVMSPPLQRWNVLPRSKDSSKTTSYPQAQPVLPPTKAPVLSGPSSSRNRSTSKSVGNNNTRSKGASHLENVGRNPTNLKWRWPAEGQVVTKFDPVSGRKGIDITGRNGQPIFSAEAGDVVYSGNGLLGYGNLVIIKHDDVYLSAYGHNSQLLVKEGDRVTSGQEIARMGVSPKEGAMLHFEIRKDGKPIDPSRLLPRKN